MVVRPVAREAQQERLEAPHTRPSQLTPFRSGEIYIERRTQALTLRARLRNPFWPSWVLSGTGRLDPGERKNMYETRTTRKARAIAAILASTPIFLASAL